MTKTFKTFYHFIFRYKGRFALFMLVFSIAVVLENLAPYYYKVLINTIEREEFSQIYLVLIAFVGVRLLANLIDALGRFLSDWVIIPAAVDARVAVFRHIQDLDFAFHVNKNTGSLISAFKRGDNAFFEMFYNIHRNIFSVIISLIVMLFFFAQVSPTIVAMTLAFFLVNSLIGWKMIESNIKRRVDFNEAEDRVSGIITDNLLNYETVKFFAKEAREEARLVEEFKDWTKKIWRYGNSFRIIDATIGSISIIGIFLVLLVVVRGLVAGDYSIGDVVLVVGFSTSFFYRFFELLWHVRAIAKHFADIEKYFAILGNQILIADPRRPAFPKVLKGEVEFRNVSFSYPGAQEQVLEDVNLRIPAGTSVAFVGRSGAGKTTITKLLMRFYDPTRGEILVDNLEIKKFTKSQLRSFMGIVPQEPILFNNTIGYNIAYGNDKAIGAEIIEAAKMANLHDFISSLPDGYETQVGERGIKLSGGQKQRLAIARMILSDPKIIIFDEATSNLDSESERLIQESLRKISKKRTVLIIAHRFSTVRNVDKIVVLENGRIVEEGSHRSLIARKDGLYRYLWQLQTKHQNLSPMVNFLK